jgi:undecaprenyl diphosphate synthase
MSKTSLPKGTAVPNHLALILDGNRRYARKRRLKFFGHKQGADKFKEVLEWCLDIGVPQVSAYVLSTENLNRPKKELDEIFEVAMEFVKRWEKDSEILDKYEVRVRFLGDLSRLPPELVRLMGRIMKKTAKYQKKTLNILIAYSSKFELTDVMRKIGEKVIKTGRVEITEKDIEKNLLVPVPVDLVIRTGGMQRLSNFLLWQSAYAEIYVTNTLWPEFTEKEFVKAIKWFSSQRKNYGK